MNQVNESMRTTLSFIVENLSEEQKRLCFFPGHYNTEKVVLNPENNNAYLLRNSAEALVAAGYNCDEVADGYVEELADKFNFKVLSKTKRVRLVDLHQYIKNSNISVSKIKITDLSADAGHDLFNHEIEIAETTLKGKGASDILQLSNFVNPRNFQTNFIEIDLTQTSMLLDETTLFIMDVVGSAKFQIDFVLE